MSYVLTGSGFHALQKVPGMCFLHGESLRGLNQLAAIKGAVAESSQAKPRSFWPSYILQPCAVPTFTFMAMLNGCDAISDFSTARPSTG